MDPFRIVRHLTLATVLCTGLLGCNLFNPSGDGTPDNVPGWIAEGDKHLAAKDYPAAQQAYWQAIALERKNDLAWSGWLEARAGIAQDSTGISLAALLIETRKLGGPTIPFLDLPIEDLDRFYRYLGTLHNAYKVCLRGLEDTVFADPIRQKSYTTVRTAHAFLVVCDRDLNGRLTASDTTGLNCLDVSQWTNLPSLPLP
jgi:hypothetical protein